MEMFSDVLIKLMEDSKKDSELTIKIRFNSHHEEEEVRLLEVKKDYIKVNRAKRITYIKISEIASVGETKIPTKPIMNV